MQFYSKPISEHAEVPVADNGRLEELVLGWDQRQKRHDIESCQTNHCYVVSLGPGQGQAGALAEILSLVTTQGDRIVGYETIKLLTPNPRTLIGKGKLREVAQRAKSYNADLLVIDAELSPSQMRNVEDIAGISVCDREAVILKVFQKHARTRRSKIQVEVAQLEYLRPRIRGLGLDMDQQASSIVTGRGPGETASAMLARKLDRRLLELKKALSKIKNTTNVQRLGRTLSRQVVLVGYTNAGKTTLMNALTGENLSARNKPFETLDTTTRRLSGHGGDVLLSDTVGFIRRLPDRLMESFESTLEGIKDAALMVLVVDISDTEKELHLKTTLKMLAKLGVDQIPILCVFNKSDLLTIKPSLTELNRLSGGKPFVSVSSHDQDAVNLLRNEILKQVRFEQQTAQVLVPYTASEVHSMIYAYCRIVRTDAKDEGLLFTFQGDAHIVAQIKQKLSEMDHA